MANLEHAIRIAAAAHEGQLDKAGAPYILHPLRVMLGVQGATERIVAVLHDVLEDTPVTVHDLRQAGFDDAVVGSLLAVTRREGESYEAFIDRCAVDPVGRAVKVADLRDNLDPRRIAHPGPRDLARRTRYLQALRVLSPEETHADPG